MNEENAKIIISRVKPHLVDPYSPDTFIQEIDKLVEKNQKSFWRNESADWSEEKSKWDAQTRAAKKLHKALSATEETGLFEGRVPSALITILKECCSVRSSAIKKRGSAPFTNANGDLLVELANLYMTQTNKWISDSTTGVFCGIAREVLESMGNKMTLSGVRDVIRETILLEFHERGAFYPEPALPPGEIAEVLTLRFKQIKERGTLRHFRENGYLIRCALGAWKAPRTEFEMNSSQSKAALFLMEAGSITDPSFLLAGAFPVDLIFLLNDLDEFGHKKGGEDLKN